MENAISVINEQEVLGKQFRMYGTFEEPFFLAKDVAEWIDYAKTGKGAYDVSKMLKTVDEDEKLIRTIFVSGQDREAWFLTEDGLYEVLMQSRKPIAKQFKKQVKAILKEIRKTGSYGNNKKMTYMEIVAACANQLVEQERHLIALEDKVTDLEDKIGSLTRSYNGVAFRHEVTNQKQQGQLDNHEQRIDKVEVAFADHGPAEELKAVIADSVRVGYFEDYEEAYNTFYEILRNVHRVNLTLRLTNLQAQRRRQDGWSDSKVNKLSKLDAITASPDIWPKVRNLIDNLRSAIYGGE